MQLKNLKIKTLIEIGFLITLLAVVILDVVSIEQNNVLMHQTEQLFEHPYKVRLAIGRLNDDIKNMRLDERSLMLKIDPKEKNNYLASIKNSANDIPQQLNILTTQYLGDPKDIEHLKMAYYNWKILFDDNVKLTLSGQLQLVKEEMSKRGKLGIAREKMIQEFQTIDSFASKKASSFYLGSMKLVDTMNVQLIVLAAIVIFLSFFISYSILNLIKNPLKTLLEATTSFQKGNLNARSSYVSTNELGILSSSFNALAETIQTKTELDEKIVSLSNVLLSNYDIKGFFRETILALASNTNAQIAAIYLLSQDKKTYNHFESFGLAQNARISFSASSFEGEFGQVIATKKMQHIKDIHENTAFAFHTVGGKFIPREIITIPILVNNEVTAIVSLGSLNHFSNKTLQFINSFQPILNARVEGVIAFNETIIFAEKLEVQNNELETQKTELSTQSNLLSKQTVELEMQNNQLGEANRLKTNFLSNMSHELRTPLNSVIALSGVLNRRLNKQIPEEELSYLEVIERNGKLLLSIINDILDIARIESGREEVEINKFNANGLIADVVSLILPQAQNKKIELLHLEQDNNLFLSTDDHKLRHVLQNIISNAVKFTESGKVEIGAKQVGDKIEISISDTGIGISEENILHIFDEFRQADSSTSRRFGGTGLGLTIAKKYTQLLGGTIKVKSTVGVGSQFIITMPINYEANNAIVEVASVEKEFQKKQNVTISNAEASTKTLLIVEDSYPAIVQMKDVFSDFGFKILTAKNGEEGLQIIAETIPDAIILDLMMPKVDGFQVLKTLRDAERTAHIPVLILTAKHISKEELKFLTKNNIHQLVQKGDVKREELLNAVSSMIFKSNTTQVVEIQKQNDVKPLTKNKKPVVLVVEDNPDNMITVRAMLAENYEILEAVNGFDGIELAQKHKPDLVLMDIALPDIDGIHTFIEIKKDPNLQYLPVIALTASAMHSDREAILAHGFNAYITKPIDDKLFYKTLNEVLYGA